MGKFPVEPTYCLYDAGAGCSLPSNPELFVIHQFQRRDDHTRRNFYELQPDLTSRKLLEIGGDGCGNYYFMAGCDRKSDELWMWVHDPYEGFVKERQTLEQYLEYHFEITPQRNPFDDGKSTDLRISRADHPLRSILDPISMEEWLAYVQTNDQLELDENRIGKNPFTKEEVVFRFWPGRVRVDVKGSLTYIEYRYGCLRASGGKESATLRALMQSIAQHFDARVF